jgi:monovalent cation/proton antiporter MnhG/PhaG subunit
VESGAIVIETGLQFLAILAVLAGTSCSVLGVLGDLRLPDTYTRLQPVGKIGIFGTGLLLLGAVAWTPLGLGNGLVLIGLVASTVTAHALAPATYRVGIRLSSARCDDLAQVVKESHSPAPDGAGWDRS